MSSKLIYTNKKDRKKPITLIPLPGMLLNEPMKMDGIEMMKRIPDASVPLCFFGPQYYGVFLKQKYGNAGEKHQKARCALPQMSDEVITNFIREIDRILIPSGHLFLWLDAYHSAKGYGHWLKGTQLEQVERLIWKKLQKNSNKEHMGMGYRCRRGSEECHTLQKLPKRVKGVWTDHKIPDVVLHRIPDTKHPHAKPLPLLMRLIRAVTTPGDVVVDPAAGSFSTMLACKRTKRDFLGCDILGDENIREK